MVCLFGCLFVLVLVSIFSPPEFRAWNSSQVESASALAAVSASHWLMSLSSLWASSFHFSIASCQFLSKPVGAVLDDAGCD